MVKLIQGFLWQNANQRQGVSGTYISCGGVYWLPPVFETGIQYIPRNMHTVFALLCFVVVIHWLIFPYPTGLLHWHFGNLTIAPMPAKQPWWIWINTSCEFIMNDCITTTKQSTTKPCAYFLGYTVWGPPGTTVRKYTYMMMYWLICLYRCHAIYWFVISLCAETTDLSYSWLKYAEPLVLKHIHFISKISNKTV